MKFPAGVLHGDQVTELFNYAKENKFAIPAMNCVGTNSVNAALETARDVKSPIIIQFSTGGAEFFAGKGLKNENYEASTAGAVSAALHVHTVAKMYGVSVILHTDHAARDKLVWIDALMKENRKYFEKNGQPLFSSHMLDLSEEELEPNIQTCVEYLKSMEEVGITLEFEIGITGGEEDGVDNTDVDSEKLYTQPEHVAYAYEELMKVSDKFLVAAAFGNVHGVYKPGNVKLRPELLDKSQKFVQEKFDTKEKPMNLVFHGGSGSPKDKIEEAISYGVVKMNIDTDTQWAFWEGVKGYVEEKHDYLQTQIGNPEGNDKPNKKIYDPRAWLREGEKSVQKRLVQAFEELNCVGRNN